MGRRRKTSFSASGAEIALVIVFGLVALVLSAVIAAIQ